MPYKDKEKSKKYQREWYLRNKKEAIKNARDRKIKHREETRKFIFEDKLSKGCCKCLEKEVCCLDYHHLDNKEIEVADAVRNSWSISRIQKEIDKCVVICANCHRKLHAKKIAI